GRDRGAARGIHRRVQRPRCGGRLRNLRARPDLDHARKGGQRSRRRLQADRKTLADRGVEMRYAPDIEEIIVSGDLAVVRLVWNVSIRRGPTPAISKEPGLDVFRRQPDGRWAI